MEKRLLVSSSRRRSRREGVLLLPGSAGFNGSGARGVGVAIWKCLLRITSAGVGTDGRGRQTRYLVGLCPGSREAKTAQILGDQLGQLSPARPTPTSSLSAQRGMLVELRY